MEGELARRDGAHRTMTTLIGRALEAVRTHDDENGPKCFRCGGSHFAHECQRPQKFVLVLLFTRNFTTDVVLFLTLLSRVSGVIIADFQGIL